MLVMSKEDIKLVLVNLLYILSWNKYYNMTVTSNQPHYNFSKFCLGYEQNYICDIEGWDWLIIKCLYMKNIYCQEIFFKIKRL